MSSKSERNAALAAFTVLMTHRSFTRAANALGISRGRLSEIITSLERSLDVHLFHRNTRRVAPTDAGSLLFSKISGPIEEVQTTLEELESSRPTPTGTLKVRVGTVVAGLVVRDILTGFLAKFPEISLDLQIGSIAGPDVECDAYIQNGWSVSGEMGSAQLGQPSYNLAFCSPSYLRGQQLPSHPSELLAHQCVRFRREDGVILSWPFEKDGERLDLTVSGPVIVNDMDYLIEAVIGGAGFGYITQDYVSIHVQAGRLVPALFDWAPRRSGHLLFWNRNKPTTGPLKALLQYLREEQ